MNPTLEEIKAAAERLHQEQKENYPWCHIESDTVEEYDYALSRNLCEVEK